MWRISWQHRRLHNHCANRCSWVPLHSACEITRRLFVPIIILIHFFWRYPTSLETMNGILVSIKGLIRRLEDLMGLVSMIKLNVHVIREILWENLVFGLTLEWLDLVLSFLMTFYVPCFIYFVMHLVLMLFFLPWDFFVVSVHQEVIIGHYFCLFIKS